MIINILVQNILSYNIDDFNPNNFPLLSFPNYQLRIITENIWDIGAFNARS